jgi:hypothetical protein
MTRVIQLIEKKKSQEPLVSYVVNHFSVFNEMRELQDDLSICDLQVNELMAKQLSDRQQDLSAHSGKVCASITLNGQLIGTSDIVGCFDSLMHSIDLVGDMRHRAFTVFAELISNALDHGILDLDSTLKNDYVGFGEYLMLKEERLNNISEGASLVMSFEYSPMTNEINFSITDSGSGYDTTICREMHDESLSGRGLSLIEQLCKSVEVIPPGNQTSVVIKREL